jgi:hypothetical protein
MSEDREILLFQNIRQVILAERWCMENKLPVRVIPVPKPYSSECGMCLEMTSLNANLLEVFLVERGMTVQRIPHKIV